MEIWEIETDQKTDACLEMLIFNFWSSKKKVPESAKTTVGLEAPKMAPAMNGATAPAR